MFKAKAIFASSVSKFGNDALELTVPTMSTSLIHDIAPEGEPEQALTWVLNLMFQHETVADEGNLSQ